MKWTSVKDRLPDEPKRFDFSIYDVWIGIAGYRVADAEFRDGKFWKVIEDADGDYSHREELCFATHWMPLPPTPQGE